MKRQWIQVLLAVAVVLGATESRAQTGVRTLTKGRLSALVDAWSGRYAVSDKRGRTVLFSSRNGLTSHISVRIDDVVWTNHGKSQMTAVWPQRNLGRGTVEVLVDRLRYWWDVPCAGGTARIVQELEPVSDSAYEEVRIHLRVENRGTRALRVGMTALTDLTANGDDRVRLRDRGTSIEREVALAGAAIPERLLLQSGAFLPDSAHCRYRGPGVTVPDRVVVGQWSYHGRLGTAVYGYEAVDLPVVDVAALLEWLSAEVGAGAQREEIGAVGFQAPPPPPPAVSTFAREFIVPRLLDHVTQVLVFSDSDATVRFHAPFMDDSRTALPARRGSWDTVFTMHAGQVVSVRYCPAFQWKPADSTTYYRQGHLRVTSTAEIGLLAHMRGAGFVGNGQTVWPTKWWDNYYLYHGNMANGAVFMTFTGQDTELTHRNDYGFLWYSFSCWYENCGNEIWFPDGITRKHRFPACSNFAGARNRHIRYWYNHYSPYHYPPDRSADGAGDAFEADQPFWLQAVIWQRPWPGQDPNALPVGYPWFHAYIHHPPRKHLGTEYTVVPFDKPASSRKEDLLRILAYEDDTEVTLFAGSPPMRLRKGEHVDTLFDRATVLRSNKPLAVYQHHLFWAYLGSDTSNSGQALPMLPHGLWGRRYHVASGDLMKHQYFASDPVTIVQRLYLIVITRADGKDRVRIDGVPLAAARFTDFEGFAYAYVDVDAAYHIVESDRPILTIACGEVGYEGWPWERNAFSYIPPFN